MFYGLLLCVVVAFAASFLSNYIPIGSVAIAIILGIILSNSIKLNEKFNKGITFSEKHILSFAIALMGVNLNFTILQELGIKTILLIVTAIVTTILAALILAKLFKFDIKFALLLGIGNGVCGSSAIAASQKIVKANEEEVGLSIVIVNFLGTIGIFLLPFIAAFVLNLSEINSGILIGNTLQAVGQVVAGGFSIGEISGQSATVVKMGRILMLTPLLFLLIFYFSKSSSNKNQKAKAQQVPLFIIGFILFSLTATFNLLPKEYLDMIGMLSHYALIIAMAGIGLKITFSSIIKDGKSALVIGSLIFLVQIILSSGLIYFLF